ncbi:alcohol dehydrogenase transcription factor myb/SANT-like domain-containing protein [Ditylenchus destructor]|uniref:Alcohol dehydrogenase transcription factor myb/SANT-like domain-containing protein n=1 Tax=Ditylenchus destructor TaxID=166010 RepID=A0AAD4MSB4_9BILA|nr:alcohol dehydrogenase transcription factor myb/SANT-like domain-containing protein [Ditylenchus destructor]
MSEEATSNSTGVHKPVSHHHDLDLKMYSSTSNSADGMPNAGNSGNMAQNPGGPSPQTPGSSRQRVVVVAGNTDDEDLDDGDEELTENNSNPSRPGSAGVNDVINSVIGGLGGNGSNGDEQNSQDGNNSQDEPSFNLKLIEAVRQSRCLYDSADRQYRSADHKIKVWNRLVQVLGFQGDARTLYNRWKQLRDKYGKEKKKMKYSGEVSQWQFFKHLEFLDPHMVDRTQQKYERAKDGKVIYKDNQPPIVITDPNFALHLINEVRLQPCLFDIKDSKYRHTEFRNQAWNEIIKNLNFPGDINAIYKQWKKIRDRYVREKRKMRMTANGEEEPSWELYQELLWIDPFLEERAAQHQQQQVQQQYSMVMQQQGGGQAQHLHHLAGAASQASKFHLQTMQLPTTSGIQTSSGRQGRILPPSTTILASGSNGTTLMMQPTIGAVLSGQASASALHSAHAQHHSQQHLQHHPEMQTLHHQSAVLGLGHPSHLGQQHVIITNEPLDGDRAFALSVAADLAALPEHARNMARAQIQHLLQNSKITIVKA